MRALMLAISLLSLSGCAAVDAPTSTPPPLATVDAARFYSGTWFEIGRRPMALTTDCVAGGTTYTPEGGERMTVLDFCHQGSPSGRLKTIGGPARIVDPGSNAKLHVSYRFAGIVPIPRDYWVVERGDDYTWFISADPSFHDLWIYTRNPHPSQAEITLLVARARALGYDTSQLEFPATGA